MESGYYDVYDGDGNLLAEDVWISGSYGGASKPKRFHARKFLFIGLLIVSLMSICGATVMSIKAANADFGVGIMLLSNLPFILIGAFLSAISVLMLFSISSAVKQINDLSISENTTLSSDAETTLIEASKDNFSAGENINMQNRVPKSVLLHCNKLEDVHLKKAIDVSVIDTKKLNYRSASPKKSWLSFRDKFIKQRGASYDGCGTVTEPDDQNEEKEIGIRWKDIDGIPYFEHYPLYEDESVHIDTIVDNYLSIRFARLFAFLKMLSWLAYPMLVLSILLQHAVTLGTVTTVILLSFNLVGMFFVGFVIYKNFSGYLKSGLTRTSAAVHTGLAFLFASTVALAIISIMHEIFYMDNSMTLCIAIMLDIVMMIDVAIQKSYIKQLIGSLNGSYKPPVHWGAIIVLDIVLATVLLVAVLGLSITVPQIKDAILAFDNGQSTDLSLPIIFWSVSGVICLIILVAAGFVLNKLLQKNDRKKFIDAQVFAEN